MKNKDCKRIWLVFDRALAHDLLRQLAILGVVLIIALALSYLFLAASNAEWEQFCVDKDLNKWLLPLYLLIDSNALNNLYIAETGHKAVHGWMLIASSLTFLFGAFIFNGVIIGIITNSIERRVKSHQEGHIHYLNSGHYIIMGYDEMVKSIISHIFEKDKDAYVLILTSAETPKIRETLVKSFSEKLMKRIIVNYGHRISTEAYKSICLEAAEQVYVVGNHKKTAHDAINVECVDSICRYLKKPQITQRPSRITCVFKDLDTYAAFKTSDIFQEVGKLNMKGGIVKDRNSYLKVLENVNEALASYNLGISKLVLSPILGGSGNKEFLALIKRNIKTNINFISFLGSVLNDKRA